MKSDAPGARVFVALGSNLGDRESHLSAAVHALIATSGVELSAASRVYETEPVGGPRQPFYLNAVVRLRTRLEPRALLERLLEIERLQGRRRGPLRDTARELDLDLLLYGDRVVDEPGLCVPHPRLHHRSFVLEPLAELAPTLRHPTLGSSVLALAEGVRSSDGAGHRIASLRLPGALRPVLGNRPDPVSFPRLE